MYSLPAWASAAPGLAFLYGKLMQLSTIIPQFLLRERMLLAIYCYLLRLVKAIASKQLVNGQIVALRPYEVCVTTDQMAYDLRIEKEAVNESVQKFNELELIECTTEGDVVKIRFKYLVLPSVENIHQVGVISNPTDCTFEQFTLEYLEYVRVNLSPKTYDNYAAILRAFGKWLGKRNIGEIAASDLEKYKIAKKALVSDHTINIHIRTLKTAMEIAIKLGKLTKNPFRAVKLIRIPQKSTPSLLKEEYLILREAIREEWLKNIVDFDILTGLRLGELTSLRWADVDIEKGKITVQSSANYQVKHGKMRVLPLHSEAVEILQKKERIEERVFLKDDGTRPSNEYVSKKFKAYVRAAGLPEEYHFHSLRATFASWCANNGVSLYTLQNLMGHSSVKVTESYTSPDQSSIRGELSKITLTSTASN